MKTFCYNFVTLILCLGFPFVLFSQESQKVVVRGIIIDENKKPLQYVNVLLVGSFDGDVTNQDGKFQFTTQKIGTQVIRASFIGYEAELKEISLSDGDTISVQIELKEQLIEMGEVVVSASAFSTGDEKGVTLRGLEVVTTPGAAADIFLAIKSFPGVAMVDEGSGLFIRGGDVSETVTILDQATVVHPYKYESPTGGVFGTISPFLVRGTFFSAGGFSARYGNALSGVLAMESQEIPERSEYILGLGLAALSVGYNTRLADGKVGIRFSGNRSFTGTMFKLNGRYDEFSVTPHGNDGNLSLIYQYSPSGKIKFFNFGSGSRIGVKVDQPSFDGIFTSEEDNRLHNIQWVDIYKGWLSKTSVSLNRFNSERDFGNLNLSTLDKTYKLRFDLQKNVNKQMNLFTGFEIERISNQFKGEIPFYDEVLDPDADISKLDETYHADRIGAYFESERQLSRRWFSSLGVRFDYHNLAEQITADPRLSVRLQTSKTTNLRFSWGIYHQYPQPFLYNKSTGNPNLKALDAQHFIGTYEYIQDNFQVRIEPYYKIYNNLLVRANKENYQNISDGYSRGVDFFLKYGAYLQTRFNGWLSYSLLQSKRLQARDSAGSYSYDNTRSDFDITHNLTVVAKTRFYQYFSLGFTYRYATGRPITPIVDAVSQQPYNYYLPIEGPVNSERLPSFQRLDTSLSYFVPFGFGNAAVFYLSVSNIFNRKNILTYDYNPDYSVRTPRVTNYSRFVYFGVSITWVGK